MQVVKLHKAGRSARSIAEEMTLSRHTVNTIIGKLDGTDRTTAKRRQMLGLEPRPKKDWRHAGHAATAEAGAGILRAETCELVKEGANSRTDAIRKMRARFFLP